MKNRLLVSFSPHLQGAMSVSSMNWDTIYALVPAMLVGLYYFGLRAALIMILAVIGAVASDAAMQKAMKRPVTINDGSAILTGLLLAMLLPAGAPWWTVIIGAAVAIILGRQMFGGLGANPFNAVIVGFLVLQLSWPAAVLDFQAPAPIVHGLWGTLFPVDASEMPLGLIKFGDQAGVLQFYSMGQAMFGGIPGGIGSTSVLALLLGGLYLVAKGVIPWQIPMGVLGGMFVFGLIFWLCDAEGAKYANPMTHLVFGYTMIGAFFLAPDPATSPYNPMAALVYGIGIGVLTLIIRYWGSYQEGMFFAIMFLNALTPALDRFKAKSYGFVKAAS